MTVVEADVLKEIVLEKYNLARNSLGGLIKESASSDISNRIPGYDIEKMDFGSYHQDHFVSLFADMRGSTERGKNLGSKSTFLTIHAIMPTLIYIVEAFGGYVIDLPGDGVMALFQDDNEKVCWSDTDRFLNKEELGYIAGRTILEMIDEVVNPILESDNIPQINFGVGISSGVCVVTKVGTDETYDTKAIGNCINEASKKSDGLKEIKISSWMYPQLRDSIKDELVNTSDGWFSYK